MTKHFDTDTTKVNSMIKSDGGKKVYVPLAPDNDALDVAHKTEIY